MLRAVIALVWGAQGITEEDRGTREGYSSEGGLEVSFKEPAERGWVELLGEGVSESLTAQQEQFKLIQPESGNIA